jgi:hypothetical protein
MYYQTKVKRGCGSDPSIYRCKFVIVNVSGSHYHYLQRADRLRLFHLSLFYGYPHFFAHSILTVDLEIPKSSFFLAVTSVCFVASF